MELMHNKTKNDEQINIHATYNFKIVCKHSMPTLISFLHYKLPNFIRTISNHKNQKHSKEKKNKKKAK